jgi:RNA polymerase primary sigma factor
VSDYPEGYDRALLLHPLLSRDEELDLLTRAQNGDREARHKLIECNQKLLVRTAKQYRNAGDLDFNDLMQEGVIAMNHAIDKFDLASGHKFSTYATWWIRQRVFRAQRVDGRTIRIPVHLHERQRRIYHKRAAFEVAGHKPTIDELSEATKLSPREIENTDAAYLRTDRVSLEGIFPEGDVADDQSMRLIDHSQDTALTAEQHLLRERVSDVLSGFDLDRRVMLQMRFGLLDGVECTYEEISQKFGLTRERIRQILSYELFPKLALLLADWKPPTAPEPVVEVPEGRQLAPPSVRGLYEPRPGSETFVGRLCKRKHRHEGENGSLRYVKNSHCVECKRSDNARRKLETAS